MRLSGAVATLVLAAALAACGGQAPTACQPADASPAASPNSNADPDLAETFPDTVGGEPLEVATFCATDLDLGGIETSPQMLDELGRRDTRGAAVAGSGDNVQVWRNRLSWPDR